MNNQILIEVKDLNVAYEEVEVLHNVNFTIQKGEFVSLVGKSGCGKSTLLLALSDFIKSEGITNVPADIGMVFQNYAVYPWLTVWDNIAFGLQHLEENEHNEIILHYLNMVGLEKHSEKYPTQLSGGQAQRVALARALAPSPQVIFMDEPFGALDMFTRDRLQEWLNLIWEKEHKTVLFVTHNIEEAIFLSDRILIMGNGTIVDELIPQFKRPRTSDIKFLPEFVKLKKKLVEELENSQLPV